MKPVHVYTALLDVLGYRLHLEQDRKSGRLDFQSHLSDALQVFDSVNNAVFRVQAISDTVVLSCADHSHFPEFLELLRRVFVAFLTEGLFIRGGVAYSRHFQSKHLTYSHAVARAYELESQWAIYPRIVIDHNVVEMYEVGEGLPRLKACGFLCSENGVYFLDVLTKENWNDVFRLAKDLYGESKDILRADEEAFTKHLRFQRYLLESRHAPEGTCPYIDSITVV